jgi:hypothetical protein
LFELIPVATVFEIEYRALGSVVRTYRINIAENLTKKLSLPILRYSELNLTRKQPNKERPKKF